MCVFGAALLPFSSFGSFDFLLSSFFGFFLFNNTDICLSASVRVIFMWHFVPFEMTFWV